MQLIVITTPESFDGEIELIHKVLDSGISRLHIRKPNDREATELILQTLSKEQLRKVTVHYFYDLAIKYGASGIQCRIGDSDKLNEWNGIIGMSCHSVAEVNRYADKYDYCFLSPIFDSVSKQGYKSAFDHKSLSAARNSINHKVIALGGILPENMGIVKEYGFGGVAVLGGIWGECDPEKVMKRLDKYLKLCR